MKKATPATIIALLCLSWFAAPLSVFAAEPTFTLSPIIVDEKAKPRDILKQTAVVTNNTERKVTIYVTVKDLDREEGEQEFKNRYESEVETSLAHWIEITRGQIELEPGETKRIPYLIQVHLEAPPGLYHASIFFQEGSNRGEAQMRRKTWHAIDVNIEIQDDANERLQLAKFISDQVFFTGNTASFSYLLENIGNRKLSPDGEIRIFNRKGEEVAALPINEENVSLLPEATSQLGTIWDTDGQFGRYKAYLDVAYGDKQKGSVTDTVYFWVVPWKQILFIFVVLAALIATTAYIAYDRYGFNRKMARVYEYESYEDDTNQTSVAAPSSRAQATVAGAAVTLSKTPVQRRAPAVPVQQQRVTATSRAQQPVSGSAVKIDPRSRKTAQPQGSVLSLKKK